MSLDIPEVEVTEDAVDGAVAAPAALPPADSLITQSCGWEPVYTACNGECEAFAAYDDPAAAQALWEAVASDMLWNWTGGMFGVCEVTVRPCQEGCENSGWSTFWGRGPGWDPGFPSMGAGPLGAAPWFPVLIAGKWWNVTCGCVSTCSCSPSGPTVISLPGPVQTVEEVWVDGVLLPSSAYRLDRKRWLIRTDGGVWPRCQNMLADPLTDEGTFQVTYTKGLPVPIGGLVAAGRLACELAMAACGNDECALPANMQTLTRQGITIGFQDLSLEPVETGIWAIDSWIGNVNKPATFASVRSVDSR